MSSPSVSATGPRFLITLPGDTPAAQVLDFWEPAAPGPLLFAPNASGIDVVTAPQDSITWRVELPANPIPARQAMRSQRTEIALVDAALHQADPRLEAFLSNYHPDRPAAFSVGAPAPEQALAHWLQTSVQPASFALEESRRAETQAAQGFLDHVRQLLSAYSWVETAIDGQVIACTRVGWTGDFDTTWSILAAAQYTAQHAQTVALALASRAVWVRFAGHMLAGAVRLGAQMATPGGAALALPGLWRYINDIIDDYRRLRRANA